MLEQQRNVMKRLSSFLSTVWQPDGQPSAPKGRPQCACGAPCGSESDGDVILISLGTCLACEVAATRARAAAREDALSLNDLDDDLVLHMLGQCDTCTLLYATAACHKWRALEAQWHQVLWQRRLVLEYPLIEPKGFPTQGRRAERRLAGMARLSVSADSRPAGLPDRIYLQLVRLVGEAERSLGDASVGDGPGVEQDADSGERDADSGERDGEGGGRDGGERPTAFKLLYMAAHLGFPFEVSDFSLTLTLTPTQPLPSPSC